MYRVAEMDMLVRINMCRRLSDEAAKGGKLTRHFFRHRRGIVQIDNLIERNPGVLTVGPLAEVQVKTNTELAVLAPVRRSFTRRRPADHQAGACHDAMFVRLDDSL